MRDPSSTPGALPNVQRLTPNACTAPTDWYYHLLPLPAPSEETLSLDWVAVVAGELMDRAEASGEPAECEAVLHWAHLLKLEQGTEGDWPAVVNARTGEALGEERTRKPAAVLARLGELLDSTEFDTVIALATR
jgi:hypothetical protein